MRAIVQLKSQSQPMQYEGVQNTYTKDGLYCIQVGNAVHKYPVADLFRIIETEDTVRTEKTQKPKRKPRRKEVQE